MIDILEILDNKSISAFVGGLTGFLLVIATDWRREWRKTKHIRAEVELNAVVARNKLQTVRRNRSLIRDHNRLSAAPILKFNTALIRSMMIDVLQRLSLDQRRALEALCYRMEAIDELLADGYSLSKQIEASSDHAFRHDSGKRLIDLFGDAITNLKVLDEMCGNYATGHFTEIVTKQYDPDQYEER